MSASGPASPARHRVAMGLALAALMVVGWWAATRPADAPPAPRADAPAAVTSAALASPFGTAAGTTAGPAEAAIPPPAEATRADTPAEQPTLAADERAQARELLRNAPALDAAGQSEIEAMLFHDAVQRLQALRDAGDHGPEAVELQAELRAGLAAREAARDLPPGVIEAARALLAGTTGASPFARQR